jgi:acetyl esterase/lipase
MITEKHRFGKHRRQYVLFFQPVNRKTNKKNVIIYYHGGGWRSGSPELLRSNAQVFVNLGYCVFMPSYRRTPFNAYPEIREDLSMSLQKIVDVMKINGLDDKKIILGGMSAGGNLAALMFYDRNQLLDIGLSQELFSGLMLFGAPLDLELMKDTFVLRDFAGKRGQKTFQRANPISYLKGDENIPVMCVHGTHDGLVPYSGALSFKEKLINFNYKNLTFITLKKASHLETAYWSIENNYIRKIIIKWLTQREN